MVIDQTSPAQADSATNARQCRTKPHRPNPAVTNQTSPAQADSATNAWQGRIRVLHCALCNKTHCHLRLFHNFCAHLGTVPFCVQR